MRVGKLKIVEYSGKDNFYAPMTKSRDGKSANSTAVQNGEDNFLTALTDDFRWKSHFPDPGRIDDLKRDLVGDLKSVPVVAEDGTATNVYAKINDDDFLTRADKELVWSCMAMVRQMFWDLEQKHADGYQWNMNWMHTRAEIDQVYEASKLLNLSGRETRDALIASLFSDSIKSRGNFIIHNVHGAQAAALVLSYFLDESKPMARKSIERIARATKEHQIAPPEFMANIVGLVLHKKLKLPPFDSDATVFESPQARVVYSIYEKIKDPFNLENLNEDKSLIVFTEEERELLRVVGVKDWYVPHPDNKNSRISHAVIAGDHSINYNNPEGFAKIALLRGPDTESFFEDATIHHSLESAVMSFTDSFKVIMPDVQRFALRGLRRTKQAVERVNAVMTELFNGIKVGAGEEVPCGYTSIETAIKRAHEKFPELYEADFCSLSEDGTIYVEEALERVGHIMDDWYRNHGSIPFSPKEKTSNEPGPGRLPFWNAPLKYPPRKEDGSSDLESLSELEYQQYLFAEKIRHIAVELLRAEQWIFSLAED